MMAALPQVLQKIDSTWLNWRPASCYPDACFCEDIRNSIIRQPVNTISSFAFAVVGIAVIRRELKRGSGEVMSTQFARYPYLPRLYASALILIGIGSAFYHASLTLAGQFFDVFGMYLLGTFILLMNISRTHVLRARTAVSAYLVLNGALAATLLIIPSVRRYLFAAVIVVALMFEPSWRNAATATTNKKHLLRSLGAIAIGFLIWVADLTKLFCRPDSPVQGHAIWHLLGAVASWELYNFYRSIPARA